LAESLFYFQGFIIKASF